MANIDVTKLEAYKTMPTVKSSDIEWMNWMNLIGKKYGTANATTIFLATWQKRGNQTANTVKLREFLKKNYNISIDENALNKIADIGSGVGHFFNGIFKVGKTTVFIVGGIMIAGLAFTVYNISRRSGDIAMSYASRGKGGK